ncbi:hypothetical protein [Paraburkholderia graminis]|uniref:hypothetical protein n=1 Tax=Paraburkholderia graminis TaxID=60548 RepID=UPI002792614F|nr:hypothetical protein [Paraburkholderia graminis]MDQ0621612.1 enamine deaminase RidA (YjgF/YER057c/UK114 family) [Paraburkholderia graminis]
MYAELTLILKVPIDRAEAVAMLTKIIGGNAVTVQSAVAGTPLMTVADLALCAEQVSTRANVVYFMAGPDTLVANVFAKSISQIRAQCTRISRQLSAAGMKMKKVAAAILVSANGSDMDILSGEEVSLLSRWWEALRDRFIGKFVPALLTVSLAALFMAGTPALKSAEIGLVAAIIGAVIDAMSVAVVSETWKWKESK